MFSTILTCLFLAQFEQPPSAEQEQPCEEVEVAAVAQVLVLFCWCCDVALFGVLKLCLAFLVL